jgi:REP element-mobilizing transposase RayT
MKPEHYKYHLVTRIKGYDYSGPGTYFITICAEDRRLILADIINSTVNLRPIGKITNACLIEIPDHFNNTNIVEYIIMPDHVHFIIGVSERDGTACRASTKMQIESFGNPVRGSIPTIIRSYKSAVTKLVHEIIPHSPLRIWQPGYYEHIIRNEEELKYTIDYIKSNPEEWERDHNIGI